MRSPGMESSFSGFVLDPSKCSSLTVDEKRGIVCELLRCSQDAPTMLQSWSRRDLLEVLCAEMGKERKYTGVTKQKLIEHLMRIVSEKKLGKHLKDGDSATSMSPLIEQAPPSKRQRKADHPSDVPTANSTCDVAKNGIQKVISQICCRNLACRAGMNLEDAFCKRCSCCICCKYDDNKDPSLWLVCSADNPHQDDSCGMSCHIECAIKHEKSGILKSRHVPKLDGTFYCASCGKMNDLLGCWRKQLMIAKDARRVDTLCYRLSLSHKLLNGTEKYQKLHEIVDEAMKKLEADVGPLDVSTIMGRSIVNRISSGAEVQKLCVHAVKTLALMLSSASRLSSEPATQNSRFLSPTPIRFEDISSTSLSVVVILEEEVPFSGLVGYTVWHRRMDAAEYPMEPTCKLQESSRKSHISELSPLTNYMFKVVAEDKEKELSMWEIEVQTKDTIVDDPNFIGVQGCASKPYSGSPKTNVSGLSDECNNTTIHRDLNKLPEDCLEACDKLGITDMEKSSDLNDTSHSQEETLAQEETREHFVRASDEEPNSTIQTVLFTKSAGKNPLSDTQYLLPGGNEMAITLHKQSESVLPLTPSKLEANRDSPRRNSRAKSAFGPDQYKLKPVKEKRSLGKSEEMRNDGTLEEDYEYCVKVVRWLECKGHIESNFRIKFLTWFSLRATPQERRVVTVFVDTLIDDPPSLAGQLIDAFAEGISNKRPHHLTTGLCMSLYH